MHKKEKGNILNQNHVTGSSGNLTASVDIDKKRRSRRRSMSNDKLQ